jgi:hypothetical protein
VLTGKDSEEGSEIGGTRVEVRKAVGGEIGEEI